MKYEEYIEILKQEMVEAMGCTEPLAVAYAGSLATYFLGQVPTFVELKCSSNIIKNVRCVNVPNSEDLNGIKAAVLLGVFGGNHQKGFGCINEITEIAKQQTKQCIKENRIVVSQTSSNEKLHIIVTVKNEGNSVIVEIKESHLNVVKVTKNGQVIFEKTESEKRKEDKSNYPELLRFDNIFEFANTVEFAKIEKLVKTQYIDNLEIAKCGMMEPYGLKIGQVILANNPTIDGKIIAYTSAASEARMCGCVKPVVINSGSGNQGISTSVPIIIYGLENNISLEKVYRALVFANLLTIKQKYRMGSLSAFCGVVSSCCSAGAGITYLAGGTKEQIKMTISNHLATVPGIICDGAKASCAAKIAVALNSALLAFHLAMENKGYTKGQGIIKETVDQTIDVVSEIGHEMNDTDEEIMKVLLTSENE